MARLSLVLSARVSEGLAEERTRELAGGEQDGGDGLDVIGIGEAAGDDLLDQGLIAAEGLLYLGVEVEGVELLGRLHADVGGVGARDLVDADLEQHLAAAIHEAVQGAVEEREPRFRTTYGQGVLRRL